MFYANVQSFCDGLSVAPVSIGTKMSTQENKQYLYTTSRITERTGLSEKQLRRFISLEVVTPPTIRGRGAKRYTEEDLQKLIVAGELIRFQKHPQKIADILKREETYLIKGRDLVSSITGLVDNPNAKSWSNFVQALLNIDGLDEQEKIVLRYIAERRDCSTETGIDSKANLSDEITTFAEVFGTSISVDELRRLRNRTYQKVGYALLSILRLQFLIIDRETNE